MVIISQLRGSRRRRNIHRNTYYATSQDKKYERQQREGEAICVVAKQHARLIRNGKTVAEHKIDALRRVKDDVKEVRAGTECGIHLTNTNEYQVGDIIEVYEIHEIRPEL